MKNIFVTGGTGVLGKRVITKLLNLEFKVVVASRSAKNETLIKELGAIPIRCDLFDEKSVINATRGMDCILHLATKIPKKSLPRKRGDWRENDKIRVQATKNLIAAAHKNDIENILTQGVLLVYGDLNGDCIGQNTPISNDLSFMLESVVEMEHLIKESKLNYSILRFGKFYGPDSFDTIELINNIQHGKMPIIGSHDIFWNFIHIEDAADAVVYTISAFDKWKNLTINLSDFNPVRYNDFIYKIGEMLGTNKKPMKIQRFVGKAILGRDLYRVFMTSNKLVTNSLEGWAPKHVDIYDEILKIAKQNDVLNTS